MSSDFHSFAHYMLAQSETRAAYAQYNHAAAVLDHAKAKERAAELASQSPETIGNGKLLQLLGARLTEREREVALTFVRYAIHGRIDTQ